MKMIKIVTIDETVLDAVIELVQDYRQDVEGGSTVVEDPSGTLHELDEALAALRGAEDQPDPAFMPMM
jgi:hypothetical protein